MPLSPQQRSLSNASCPINWPVSAVASVVLMGEWGRVMVKVLLAGYAIKLDAFFEQKFVDVYHAAAGENFFKADFPAGRSRCRSSPPRF